MAELSENVTPEEEASWSEFPEENNNWIFSRAKEARQETERGKGISLEKGFGFLPSSQNPK